MLGDAAQDDPSAPIIVDLRSMQAILETQNKILRRLDSFEEEQRQQAVKLDALFTAPLLSTDIVANEQLLYAPSDDRHLVADVDDDYRLPPCCCCALLHDWYIVLCGW